MNSMNSRESDLTKAEQQVESDSSGTRRRSAGGKRQRRQHIYQASWSVEPATAADHFAIHRFLLSVYQRPSAAEFQAQLDDPFYEPSTRLVIRDGKEIVAHLRAVHREIRFENTTLPVTFVADVATLPGYRGRGCGTALLTASTRRMIADGTVLGLLCTNHRRYYERRGWVVCGRHSYATADARALRSQLQAEAAEREGRIITALNLDKPRRYTIRLWRHVERGALMRLYNQFAKRTHGALERTLAYWKWLLGHNGHDRIYIAILGRDKLPLDDQMAPIVGYAVTKGGNLVELVVAEDHPEARRQLLLRACGDAIEQDVHSVRLDAPRRDALDSLFRSAGGQIVHEEVDHSHVFMARLPKPRMLLHALQTRLYERAREANLDGGCELGVKLEHGRLHLRVKRNDVTLISGKLGRSYLQCTAMQLTQLLLGHLDLETALRTGRIRASTRLAERTALALFPRLSWWHPRWDFLPSS